jgi:hypothetical protein
MKRKALRPVALVARSAFAVILFSLVVPPLTQAPRGSRACKQMNQERQSVSVTKAVA